MRTPALILVALLAGACTSGGAETPSTTGTSPTTSTTTATTSAVAGAGRCADVAQDGVRVTDTLIDKGCTDENGTLRLGKITRCKDGRRMWEMGELIGLSGEPMILRDTKTGDGIQAWTLFYRVCVG